MLKIAGVIFCIAGSSGYGWLKIQGWRNGLGEIKIWVFLFQKIKSCILYQKETLEGSCIWVGEKEMSKQAGVLKKIGERARTERQKEFDYIWTEEMEMWCKKTTLPKKAKRLLLQFPEYIQEADEQLQMNLFTVYMEELKQEKGALEQQIREQQKPVMAVSMVMGMVLSLLLV